MAAARVMSRCVHVHRRAIIIQYSLYLYMFLYSLYYVLMFFNCYLYVLQQLTVVLCRDMLLCYVGICLIVKLDVASQCSSRRVQLAILN